MSLHSISGYEGLYSVSDDGKIFSHYMNSFMNPRTKYHGYKYVGLHKDGKTKNFHVHRLVMHAIKGMDLNEKLQVDHIDRNRANNHPDNLRLLNDLQNKQHAAGRLGVDTETHKLCSKCKIVLPRSSFGFNAATSDKLSSACKPCRNGVKPCL